MHYSYLEVISTHNVKSDDGILFLDIKCDNFVQQRVTRIQADQAHEISRLIHQYVTIREIETSSASSRKMLNQI